MEGELIQQSSTLIGGLIGGVIILGLIYFVYTRVKRALAKRKAASSGSGNGALRDRTRDDGGQKSAK